MSSGSDEIATNRCQPRPSTGDSRIDGLLYDSPATADRGLKTGDIVGSLQTDFGYDGTAEAGR